MRRSKRLSKSAAKTGTPSHGARSKQKDTLSAQLEEGGHSQNSSSEEWQGGKEDTDSETDIEDDGVRGNGNDEVSPVGVVKPHKGNLHPQVSASILGFFNQWIRIICDG